MSSADTAEAALKLEIARLTGAINRHRSGEPSQVRPKPSYPAAPRQFKNTYVNPSCLSLQYVPPLVRLSLAISPSAG
ncbi:hypothetical protein BV25DRAFT_1705556 [Artomyces pyxidatus]|uniref:Uncharacterized protein n=1 Tax=Artomyces pyxidatus TaxID=48021 RepID=A0ACB8T9P9_9AGAM|nr:hypothetical protein BV25DRAFT_1705556 [Artomyces pyxidatus]